MDKLIEGFWTYVITFVVLLFLNQLLFFRMCLSPGCLAAATPHVLFLTAIVGTWLIRQNSPNKQSKNNESKPINSLTTPPVKPDIEETIAPTPSNPELTHNPAADQQRCPKCNALMVLRTASRGKYQGKQFLGCSQWPKCNGIVNL